MPLRTEDRALADVTGNHLRADIADAHLRHANVGTKQRQEGLVQRNGTCRNCQYETLQTVILLKYSHYDLFFYCYSKRWHCIEEE